MVIKKTNVLVSVALIAVVALSFVPVSFSTSTTLLSSGWSSTPNGSLPSGWRFSSGHPVSAPGTGAYDGSLVFYGTHSMSQQVGIYTQQAFANLTISVNAFGSGPIATVNGFPYCLSPASSNPGNNSPVIYVFFRSSITAMNGYFFRFDIDKVQINIIQNGFDHSLVTKGLGQFNPLGNFTVTVSAQGSTLTASYTAPLANGKVATGQISATDSTFSTGFVGIGTYNCNAGFTSLVLIS